ncbi:MAG: hypothetical protein JWO89_3750, partial [Verrucomicrobiaceae bacterium]|nr:hypothetical protein [Verrucomicrobiaceae bacterium]
MVNPRYLFVAMLFAGLVLWVSQKIVLHPQPNSKHRLFGGTTGMQPTVD